MRGIKRELFNHRQMMKTDHICSIRHLFASLPACVLNNSDHTNSNIILFCTTEFIFPSATVKIASNNVSGTIMTTSVWESEVQTTALVASILHD